MKVSYKVLQKYVANLPEVDQVAQDLIMHTAEVEEIVYQSEHLSKVFIGEVLECIPHPDSQKLNICQVLVCGETKQIVCGAPNVKSGIKVAVATLWAQLTPEFTIAKTKIRGEVSEWMLCSEDELGMTQERQEGIFILATDAPLGLCLRDYLGQNDVILEVDNKAINHRPDLFSHIGIARELAAIYNTAFDFEYAARDFSSLPDLVLKNNIPDVVRRYMALKVRGVSNRASNSHICDVLASADAAVKWLLIDISNYSLYLYGQPTHCFDASTLVGDITIRYALSGESFIGLDDKTYQLWENDIVIADDVSVLALGGIMGSKHSAVSDTTTDIIIEAAHFDQAVVRKTGKTLGIRTDALNVFEKDLLPVMAEKALALIVDELQKTFPDLRLTAFSDSYTDTQVSKTIDHDPVFISSLIGHTYSSEMIIDICQRLGITQSQGILHVPFWRKDLSYKADIAEEIARIDGYDAIEMTVPRVNTGAVIQDNIYKLKNESREYFSARGFFDMYSYSFVCEDLMQRCWWDCANLIPLKNSLSEDATHMKGSLIPNLLFSVQKNIREIPEMKLFELEKVYHREGAQITEHYNLSALIVSPQSLLYYDIQSQLSDFLKTIGIYAYRFTPTQSFPDYAHQGRVAAVVIRWKTIWYIGEIHPRIANRFDVNDRIGFFEIDADALSEAMYGKLKAKDISEFQENKFDLNFVVDKNSSGEKIKSAIEKTDATIITKVDLIDIYESEEKLPWKRSLTFKVYIQSMTETLDDTVKNNLIKNIITNVEKMGWELR